MIFNSENNPSSGKEELEPYLKTVTPGGWGWEGVKFTYFIFVGEEGVRFLVKTSGENYLPLLIYVMLKLMSHILQAQNLIR